MGEITLNGEKLDVVIDRQCGEELHEALKPVRTRRHVATRKHVNHSRTRSSPASGKYLGDPKATHVMLLGELYPMWGEHGKAKFGFEPSGQSIRGALEVNEPDNTVKCHECAGWFESLGPHVAQRHKALYPTVRKYKEVHGFSVSRSLITPRTREKIKAAGGFAKFRALTPENIAKGRSMSKRSTHWSMSASRSAEYANLLLACRRQTEEQFQLLARTLGRVPTQAEMHNYRNEKGHKLFLNKRIKRLYGSVSNFMVVNGLRPRPSGSHNGLPLPSHMRPRVMVQA